MQYTVTAEAINVWFDPFHFCMYLVLIFVGMVVWYEWRWAKVCRDNIQVLVVQEAGSGRFMLAPKVGGSISLKNPNTEMTRTWPINELATIDILYPGVAFVPAFLQKTIRLAIVSESDWEPMLNRSPHMKDVASPDIVVWLQELAKVADDKLAKVIKEKLENVSTSPTREMIGSPAFLGNLLHERISEIITTVSKDIMNPLTEAIKRLGQMRWPNPLIVYIGLGFIAILQLYSVYQFMPVLKSLETLKMAGDIAHKLDLILKALGVTGGG